MKYRIALWCGKGYYLNKEMVIEADSVEEALTIASIKDENCYYYSIDVPEGIDNDERFIYLDRSEYGKENIYLLIENAIIDELKEDTEDEEIKHWYQRKFPEDNLGKTINEKVTFYDLYMTLDTYQSVYKLLGDEIDSVVRERVFQRLAEIMDVEYEDIYNQWMMCNED